MIYDIVVLFLLSLGTVILFFSALALLRFEDVYMKIHASSMATFGGSLSLLGLIVKEGFSETSGMILLLLVIAMLTSPIVGHAFGCVSLSNKIDTEKIEKLEYPGGEKGCS